MFLEECGAALLPPPAAPWVQQCDWGMNSSPVLFLPGLTATKFSMSFCTTGGSEPWASGLLQEQLKTLRECKSG